MLPLALALALALRNYKSWWRGVIFLLNLGLSKALADKIWRAGVLTSFLLSVDLAIALALAPPPVLA